MSVIGYYRAILTKLMNRISPLATVRYCFWGILLFIIVSVSTFLSYLSPGGFWGNLIFNYGFTGEGDPGGFYLMSAHEIFNESGRPLFIGHPGITLQIILYIIQIVYFGLFGDGTTGFSLLIAKDIVPIYIISKIFMSIISFISLFALYLLSRQLGLTRIGAITSVLAYASCFPFLFYVTRISPESLAVSFSCFCLVCLFMARRNFPNTSLLRCSFLLFFSGVFCALAMLSKLNQTSILPLLIVIGTASFTIVRPANHNRSHRLRNLCILPLLPLAGVALVLYLVSGIVDWSYFLATWASTDITPVAGQPASILKSLVLIGGKLLSVFQNLFTNITKLNLRPQAGFNGMFNLLEFVFVTTCLFCFAFYIRKNSYSFEHRITSTFILWTLLIWWYRGTTRYQLSFHYLFFFMLFLSIYFAFFVEYLIGIFDTYRLRIHHWQLLAIVLIVIHSPSIWAFVDTRISDIKYYRQFSKSFFDLHSKLATNKQVAILTLSDTFDRVNQYHGIDFSYAVGRRSKLQDAFPLKPILVRDATRRNELESFLRSNFKQVVDLIQGIPPDKDLNLRMEPVSQWILANRPIEKIVVLPIINAAYFGIPLFSPPKNAGTEFDFKNAFDGNVNSTWYSYPSANPSVVQIEVDMGVQRKINIVKIRNCPYDGLFPKHIRVTIVKDNNSRNVVFDKETSLVQPNAWFQINLMETPGKVIRFEFLTSKHPTVGHFQFGLSEIQIIGLLN